MTDRKKVYVYTWPDEKEIAGVACDCHMHQRPGEAWEELWFFSPPDRGHMIRGAVVAEAETGFTFRSDGHKPGLWTFIEMTIEDFRRKYHKDVSMGAAIAVKLKTTDDLHEWYRKTYHFPAE